MKKILRAAGKFFKIVLTGIGIAIMIILVYTVGMGQTGDGDPVKN